MNISRLIQLLQLSDSALPVGAFAFSNSLETAVEQRIVHDAATLATFVDEQLWQSASTDGIAALAAHRATIDSRYTSLHEIDARLIRCKLLDEVRLMLCRMGRKLAELTAQITDDEWLTRWRDDIIGQRTAGCYPVTLGITFGRRGLDEQSLFAAQQYGVMTTTLNAALRCLRLTHYDSQRIIAHLALNIEQRYEQVRDLSIEQMHSFAPTLDVLAAMHERGRARLFMN